MAIPDNENFEILGVDSLRAHDWRRG